MSSKENGGVSGHTIAVTAVCFAIVIGILIAITLKSSSPPTIKSAWTEQALSSTMVASGLGSDRQKFPVLKVEVYGKDVTVVFNAKESPDSTVLIEDAGMAHIAVCKTLFHHPDVASVETMYKTELVDPYGKTSLDNVATIEWSRNTFSKISFPKFEEMGVGEQSYTIADSYNIHSALWRKYEHKDRLGSQTK